MSSDENNNNSNDVVDGNHDDDKVASPDVGETKKTEAAASVASAAPSSVSANENNDDDDDDDDENNSNNSSGGELHASSLADALATAATRPSPPTCNFNLPTRVASPPMSAASSLTSFNNNNHGHCHLPPINNSNNNSGPQEPPENDVEVIPLDPEVDDESLRFDTTSTTITTTAAAAAAASSSAVHGNRHYQTQRNHYYNQTITNVVANNATSFAPPTTTTTIVNHAAAPISSLEPPGQNESKESLTHHFARYNAAKKSSSGRVDQQQQQQQPSIHNIQMNARGHVYLDGEEASATSSSALDRHLSGKKTSSSSSRSRSHGKNNKSKDPKTGNDEFHTEDEFSTSTRGSSAYRSTAVNNNNHKIPSIHEEVVEELDRGRGNDDAETVISGISGASYHSFNASRYPHRPIASTSADVSHGVNTNKKTKMKQYDVVATSSSSSKKQPTYFTNKHHHYPTRDPSSSYVQADCDLSIDSHSQSTVDSFNASKKAIADKQYHKAAQRVMNFDKDRYRGDDVGNSNGGVGSGSNNNNKGRDVTPDAASVVASIDRSLNSIETGNSSNGSLRRTVKGSGGGAGGGGSSSSKVGRDMHNSRRKLVDKAKDSDVESVCGGRRKSRSSSGVGGGSSSYHGSNRVSFADQKAQTKSSSSSSSTKDREPSFQTFDSSWKRPSSISGGSSVLSDMTNRNLGISSYHTSSSSSSSSKSKSASPSYVKKYGALLTALAVTMCVSMGNMFDFIPSLQQGGSLDESSSSALRNNIQRELFRNGESNEEDQNRTPAKGIMDNVHPSINQSSQQQLGAGGSNGASASNSKLVINGEVDWNKVPPHLKGYYAKIFGLQQQQREIERQQQLQQQQQQPGQSQLAMPDLYDHPIPALGITDLQNELHNIQNEIDQQLVNIDAASAIQNIGDEGMAISHRPKEESQVGGDVSGGGIPMMNFDEWQRQQEMEEGGLQQAPGIDSDGMRQEQMIMQEQQQQQVAEEEASKQREEAEARQRAQEDFARLRAGNRAADEQREQEQLAMIEREVARRKEEEARQQQEIQEQQAAEAQQEGKEMPIPTEEEYQMAQLQDAQSFAAEDKTGRSESRAQVLTEKARRDAEMKEESKKRQKEAEEWMQSHPSGNEGQQEPGKPMGDEIEKEGPQVENAIVTLDSLQSEIAELMNMMQQKAGGLRKRG